MLEYQTKQGRGQQCGKNSRFAHITLIDPAMKLPYEPEMNAKAEGRPCEKAVKASKRDAACEQKRRRRQIRQHLLFQAYYSSDSTSAAGSRVPSTSSSSLRFSMKFGAGPM